MHVIIRKNERRLYLMDGTRMLLCAPVGLGRTPVGAKRREGDGKTPEGSYTLCLIKPNAIHHVSSSSMKSMLLVDNAALD